MLRWANAKPWMWAWVRAELVSLGLCGDHSPSGEGQSWLSFAHGEGWASTCASFPAAFFGKIIFTFHLRNICLKLSMRHPTWPLRQIRKTLLQGLSGWILLIPAPHIHTSPQIYPGYDQTLGFYHELPWLSLACRLHPYHIQPFQTAHLSPGSASVSLPDPILHVYPITPQILDLNQHPHPAHHSQAHVSTWLHST